MSCQKSIGWQRSDVIDTPNGKQLANLLEADFRFAPSNHRTNSFAFDSPALNSNLLGDP